MRRVKSYLRLTMVDERLSNLITYKHRHVQVDLSMIMDDFLSRRNRLDFS